MFNSILVPLYEDWFDKDSNNPANIIDPKPEKQQINIPLSYIYDNDEIIIAENPNNEKYIIDLITLDNLDPELYKQLAIEYVGIIKNEYGKDDYDYDFETADIHSLSDIPPEAIISYVNENFESLTIGTNIDDFLSGNMFVIKINDEISQELLSIFDDIHQYL
jgi:hypothetical protein